MGRCLAGAGNDQPGAGAAQRGQGVNGVGQPLAVELVPDEQQHWRAGGDAQPGPGRIPVVRRRGEAVQVDAVRDHHDAVARHAVVLLQLLHHPPGQGDVAAEPQAADHVAVPQRHPMVRRVQHPAPRPGGALHVQVGAVDGVNHADVAGQGVAVAQHHAPLPPVPAQEGGRGQGEQRHRQRTAHVPPASARADARQRRGDALHVGRRVLGHAGDDPAVNPGGAEGALHLERDRLDPALEAELHDDLVNPQRGGVGGHCRPLPAATRTGAGSGIATPGRRRPVRMRPRRMDGSSTKRCISSAHSSDAAMTAGMVAPSGTRP